MAMEYRDVRHTGPANIGRVYFGDVHKALAHQAILPHARWERSTLYDLIEMGRVQPRKCPTALLRRSLDDHHLVVE